MNENSLGFENPNIHVCPYFRDYFSKKSEVNPYYNYGSNSEIKKLNYDLNPNDCTGEFYNSPNNNRKMDTDREIIFKWVKLEILKD